ncbi:MAG: hypothetical protein ACYTG7_09240, partial [Planctomycetota bacterium]
MEERKPGPDDIQGNGSQTIDEVRVIHDVRPVRRGMGGLVLLLVLLVGLVGAGYYYFFHMGPAESFAPLEAEEGNLLALGWSFEASDKQSRDVSELWELKTAGDSFFALNKKEARSGLYAVKASMPDNGLVRAEYLAPLEIHPRRQYTASAWVKVTGGAMVALKAALCRSGDQPESRTILYTDEFVSDRERSADYVKISGTVYPSPEAEEMIFSIVAAGKGDVVVDDVALFEESSTTNEQLGTSGVMDFFPSGGGFLVRRIDHTLFVGGRLVAVEPSRSSEGASTFDSGVFDSDAAGFNPQGEGYLYTGEAAGLVRATRGLKVSAQKIVGTLNLSAFDQGVLNEVRYGFDLFPEYAQGGVGVLTGDDFNLFQSSFPPVQADALVLGGENDRIKILFERTIPVMGTLRKDNGLSVQCLFDPSKAIELGYEIRSDFTEENKEAHALLQQALKSQQEKRYGRALGRIQQLLERYPYNRALMERAEALRSDLLGIKSRKLADIQDRLRSAEFLNTPEQFTSLDAACTEALQLFPGDKDFQAALDTVREKGSALLESLRNREAERLFLLVKNLHEAGGRETTLLEIQEYMKAKFPKIEWT